MKKGVWIALTVVVIAAVLISSGIFRSSLTDIAHEEGGLEQVDVGLYQNDEDGAGIQEVRKTVYAAPIILKVKGLGERSFEYCQTLQKVVVEEVYRGEPELQDSEIWVAGNYLMMLTFGGMNTGFVNFVQEGQEYLIFLDHQADNTYTEKKAVYFMPVTTISTVFCYSEIANRIPEVDPDCSTVRYGEVKDNEFFVKDEETLEAILELKKELLAVDWE